MGEKGSCSSDPNDIRKSINYTDRLNRLRAFFLTMRAAWGGGYVIEDKIYKLRDVDTLIQGTKIVTGKNDGSASSRETRIEVCTCRELKLKSSTAMEVAVELAQARQKVAVVNAASAYHAGGGSSTGGRHALEEACCMTSTL